MRFGNSTIHSPSAVDAIRAGFDGSNYFDRIYVVGGSVRDLVLGSSPVDLDLLVVGSSDSGVEAATYLAKRLQVFSPGSNPVVYPRFGTALVRLSDGTKAEFVGAIVGKGGIDRTLLDDALRRDFTINTLMQRLDTGEIIDPTGLGIGDLESRQLRTPIEPDLTFSDDPLRLIRAVRFTCAYQMNLSLELIRSIRTNAHLLGEVSRERVRDELGKLLLLDVPSRAIRFLNAGDLLPEILPELVATMGIKQNEYHNQDVFGHSIAALDAAKPTLLVRLAALLHDIGKPATRTDLNGKVQFIVHQDVGARFARNIMRRLKYGNSDINAVAIMVARHMDLKIGGPDASGLRDRHLRLFINRCGDLLDDVLNVIHADNVSHAPQHSMPDQIQHIRRRIAHWDLDRLIRPDLPVDGHDLLDLGLSGPQIGQVLERITKRYVEHDGIDRKTALQIAKHMATSSYSDG